MAWRAQVDSDFARRGVAITIGYDVDDDGMVVVQPLSLQVKRETLGASLEPSLRLEDEAGRALYEALSRYYGSGDVLTLRALLDQERQRCDRLIEHLAAAARAAE